MLGSRESWLNCRFKWNRLKHYYCQHMMLLKCPHDGKTRSQDMKPMKAQGVCTGVPGMGCEQQPPASYTSHVSRWHTGAWRSACLCPISSYKDTLGAKCLLECLSVWDIHHCWCWLAKWKECDLFWLHETHSITQVYQNLLIFRYDYFRGCGRGSGLPSLC